jgi:hypothetical protein
MMKPEKIKKYEVWRKELITVAVRDFGYAIDVIEPVVNGHEYQVYFEDGDTPHQAIQNDELTAL